MARKKKRSIYDKYRKILDKPNLSDEEIDKMRKNIRILALFIVGYVSNRKINQIY